jgi:histone H1/5
VGLSGRVSSILRNLVATKKSKGVLQQIGDAVTAGAEAVIDAGAKAAHAVGDLLPAAKKPGKTAKAATAKTAKSAGKAPKKASPKAAASKVKTAKIGKATKTASARAAKPGVAKKKTGRKA